MKDRKTERKREREKNDKGNTQVTYHMTAQQLFSERLSPTISLVLPVKRCVKSSVVRSEFEIDETGMGMPFPLASREPPDM